MKKKSVVGLYITLLVLMNAFYLVIELYKNQIAKPFVGGEITKEVFMQLDQLNKITTAVETLLFTVILFGAIFIIFKKRKDLLKQYVVINGLICLFFYVAGNLLAFSLEAPRGNLTQQLFGAVFILSVLVVYGFIKLAFKKKKISLN